MKREGRTITAETRLALAVLRQRPRPARRIRRKGLPYRPDLTITKILAWADDHHARTGRWPSQHSGHVLCQYGEKWRNVTNALRYGLRGLPGGDSLACLLQRERGSRHHLALPRLTIRQILAWADSHHRRTGEWPSQYSGPVADDPGEKWQAVDAALRYAGRGLPGGSSVALLLMQHRGVRNRKALPKLTQKRILAWADAHHARTGSWPHEHSGAVVDAPGETWLAVTSALSSGIRGLPGGSSLAKLLAARRGARNIAALPRCTIRQILRWADAHHRRTGLWPRTYSGPIPGAPGENWTTVSNALRFGRRGLPGGDSLARVLFRHRGVHRRSNVAALRNARLAAQPARRRVSRSVRASRGAEHPAA